MSLRGYKAVLTAGGIGTRLLPFSKEIPKEMAPVIGRGSDGSPQVKPIIHAIFEQLYSTGIRDYFLIVGRGKRAIEEHFTPDTAFIDSLRSRGKTENGLTEFYGMLKSSNMVFVSQPEPIGFGDAVLRARPYISSDFLVHAGDTLILSKGNRYLKRLSEAHNKYRADATVLLQDVEDPRAFGVVTSEEIRPGVVKIKEAVEKPKRPKSKTAIMPVYFFKSSIFDFLSRLRPGKGGEIQLTDAIESLIESGRTAVGVKLRRDEIRLDIGSPETLLEALRLSGDYQK